MNKMKNMVILKDVHSNLIEEAIVVFKEDVKVQEKNVIKNNYSKPEEKGFKDGLCVKEAENIISDYIAKIEKRENEYKLDRKCKYLKIINVCLTIVAIILAIL
jgi:hypothetical protein